LTQYYHPELLLTSPMPMDETEAEVYHWVMDLPEPKLVEEIERRAVDYAQECGAVLLEHFKKPIGVEYKDKHQRDMVTKVDKQVEAQLREAIARDFPGHGIIGEESEDSSKELPDFVWVLDPLDGTTNYANGLPAFGVSIGVLYQRRPIVGCIFVPVGPNLQGGVFHCRLGAGAFLNGELVSASVPQLPSQTRIITLPARHYWQFSFGRELWRSVGEPRTIGSISYELTLATSGVSQLSIFTAPRIWDVAAGVLLVREAGGLVLCRGPARRIWAPLEDFTPPKGKALREWRATIAAGNPETVRLAAREVHFRSHALWRLRRLLRRVLRL